MKIASWNEERTLALSVGQTEGMLALASIWLCSTVYLPKHVASSKVSINNALSLYLDILGLKSAVFKDQ